MHWNQTSKRMSGAIVLLLSGAAVALCTGGCKEAPATSHRATAGASAERGEPVKLDEQNDYVVVVRREQLLLRADLQAKVADIERKLEALAVDGQAEERHEARAGASKVSNRARVTELLERRQQLMRARTMLDRSDDRGWEDLKASIVRDLTPKRPPGGS